MKINQVREMPEADLKISLKDNFEALENLRFRHAIGQLENYKSLTNTKRDIARIYTIMREKELKLNENMKKEVKKSVKNADKKIAKVKEEISDEAVKEKKSAVKKVTAKKTVKKAVKKEETE